MNPLLALGIACIIAAIVGGGFKGLGIEIRVLHSVRRQLLLAAVGVMLCLTVWVPTVVSPPVDAVTLLAQGLDFYDLKQRRLAFENFKEAAQAGSIEAAYHLGEMYWHGEDVVEDKDAAYRWIEVAASAGYAPAQAQFSNLFLEEQDYENAILQGTVGTR